MHLENREQMFVRRPFFRVTLQAGMLAAVAAASASCVQGDDAAGEHALGVRSSECRWERPRPPWQMRHRAPILATHPNLYVPQESPAATQAAQYRAEGREDEARLIQAMADQARTTWLTGGTPEEVGQQVRDVLHEARKQHQLPVFAVYYVPGRDCSQYSAGGARSEEEYRAFIDAIAASIGHHAAVVLLEPDGVALLSSEPWCGEGGGAFSGEPEDLERVHERFRELRYAVERLERQPLVDVYLDAGHSAWHPLNDYDAYYGEPALQYGIVNRLLLAGITQARGFFLNQANSRWTEDLVLYGERVSKCLYLLAQDPDYAPPDGYAPNVEYDEAGEFASPCPSLEELDALPVTPESRRALPHFVLDTSRNGQGPWNLGDPNTVNDDAAAFESLYGFSTTDPQIWCNAPGRGVGLRPSTETGHPLLDAYVWLKVPGESDGQCSRNVSNPDPDWPAQFDVAWGQVDPPAGAWFEAQALELARLAVPPLVP